MTHTHQNLDRTYSDNLERLIEEAAKDEPKVWLTVEEAEKLMKLLDRCELWLTNNYVSYDCDAWASLLEERIEQAGKENE